MLKLFKTIIKTGEATTKYPFKPLDLPDGFRGKPEYDAQQCIVCGACTAACPANALTMENNLETGERYWQLFLGRCIYCGRCEEVCPTRAIVLSDMFETAVTQKSDLYIKGTFKLLRCRECHQPFTPKKSVDYAMALLVHSGWDEETVESMRPQFETCPDCKRKHNLLSDGQENLSMGNIGSTKK
ncbi:formate hydrogenlyase subunit 6 [Proteus hauseri ATCC 700826]|uniref:Formate hydrogenlyase subunit 6 n=1 Tax=Proteus hauseri ATCC 700826 TaxID=1354271 RepID=A0AAJ3HPY1_PROHU|nr:hydrogenase 4 subunit H [Proteus hauseri]OAT45037.1 formate hydrogenlyase subunit 6 [Proteus hauseri ATCC 700826]